MAQLVKQSLDQRIYSFDFSLVSEIASGAKISTVAITSSPVGLSWGSPSISSSGKIVYLQINSGTEGVLYNLTLSATLDSAAVFAEDVPIAVF